MKKVFFLFACLSVFSLSTQAQKKACTKSKASCAKMKTVGAGVAVDDAVVAKAASLDDAVERRVCSKSGKVSYHMNYKCAETGSMTSKEVNYDAATAKFVNISPREMAPTKGKKACCSSGSCKKACCAKKGAVKTKANVEAVEEKSKAIKVSTISNGTREQ